MVFPFRKEIQRILFWVGLLFLIATGFYVAEIFYPGFDRNSVPYIGFALFAFVEGVFLIALAPRLAKTNPRWFCDRIAKYEIAANPFFSVFAIYLSLTLPLGEHNWLYFVNLGLTVLLFASRMFIVIRLNKLLKNGENGYIGLRNHSWIAASFLAVTFNYYVLSAIKMHGIDITEIATKGAAAVLTDLYAWLTVIETIVVIIVLMQSMLMTISTYYSAKEDTAFDFKTNLGMTAHLFVKYEVSFWLGIFATSILLVLSIISTTRLFNAYISLVFLYASILIIRIPTFFQKKHLDKVYGEKTYPSFLKKHGILIYASVLLIAYSVVCFIFANETFSHTAEEVAGRTEFITLGIFVPWALVKAFLGVKSYQIARKSQDPTRLLNAYLDILVAIYTIAKVFFIVAGYTHIEWVKVAGTVVGAIITVYCVVVSIRLLIVGILGLTGKRKTFFDKIYPLFDPLDPIFEKLEKRQKKKAATQNASIEIEAPLPQDRNE